MTDSGDHLRKDFTGRNAEIRRLGSALAAAALLVTAIGGCQTQQPEAGLRSRPSGPTERPPSTAMIEPTEVEARDDITSIVTFWSQTPWILREGQIVGVRAATYFVSAQTQRGVFVPGDIRVELRVIDRLRDGRRVRRSIHEWVLDRAAAMDFRVRKRAIGGYYYGLLLIWPQELALEGRSIELVFRYQRLDGREIEAPPKHFEVPQRDGAIESAPLEPE